MPGEEDITISWQCAQVLLFTATMQPEVAQAAMGWQRDPIIIDMHHEGAMAGSNVIQVRSLCIFR